MPSVSLPCPSCSTPLTLDEANAGEEVLCPGCHARLKLPAKVSPVSVIGVLENPPAGLKGQAAKAASALPQSRSKSSEDEIRRLAAAAAAAGGANAFRPEEAALPADHHRTVLPGKRTLAPAPGLEENADASLPAEPRAPVVLPTRRSAGAPLDPHQPPRPSDPIEPRADLEIGTAPLRGPSRFVRPEREAPLEEAPPPPPADPEAESPADGPAKRGFRLGGERHLHFTPVHTPDTDAETGAWGSGVSTPDEAARSRRLVSLALLIVLLAIGGLGIYALRRSFQAPVTDPSNAGELSPEDAKAQENVMRNVEEARLVLDRFLAADTVDKLAAEVRHPEITRPRMERYYAATPLKARKKRSESQSWNEIRIGDAEFIRASWELDDFRIYTITLELTSGSAPKVDWESFVNWSELPWKDFLKSPPEQSINYRVTATISDKDQYYNYFSKGRELDLLCFKLEDPEKYGSCWAYCDKDSEVASTLLIQLKSARRQGLVNAEGKTAITCILRLRFPPEGMKSNQVLIEKFINDSWVEP